MADPMASERLWDDKRLENPHTEADKRSRVQGMFSAIAPSYDLNNRLHSLGIDQYWRRQAVKLSRLQLDEQVIDVACGTGDLSFRFARTLNRLAAKTPQHAVGGQVIGIDFTFAMLPIAKRKSHLEAAPGDFGKASCRFIAGDAQALPLADASADVVSIAFGIRNVQDTLTALTEFRRVLRPGGRCVILEFSTPKNPIVRGIYNLYSAKLMPLTATWLSGDKSGAYKYLPQSVATFLTPAEMLEQLRVAGFDRPTATPLTFGTVTVYVAHVPGERDA